MSPSSLTLLNDIFVQSPGDFLFFLVVMVLNLISLLMSFALKTTQDNAHQRYTMALSGIVFAWSLMFAGILFINFANQEAKSILPPLERASTAASLLLLGWAFLTADHARWRKMSNTIVLVLLLVVAVAYAITGIIWVEISSETDFNLSTFGLVWTFTLFAIPIMGALLTVFLFREVVDAPLKLVYFVLIAFGGGLTIYQMQAGLIGDYMGIYRMTYTLSQVIVPLIVYRAVINQYEYTLEDLSIRGRTPVPPPQMTTLSPPPTPEPPRISHSDALNAQLLKAMGMMLETGDPEDIPAQIVNTLLDVLRADVGALLRLQDINYADISVAQDRMMSKKITSTPLNLDNQPTLVNAIERRTQRGLYPDRNQDELEDLYERMYIEQRGPVYFQPLTHNREVFAVILVAMPYTKRELRAEEVELLKGIGTISGSLLAVSYTSEESIKHAQDRIIQAMVVDGASPEMLQDEGLSQAREGAQQKLVEAREEIKMLTNQVTELNLQLTQEQGRLLSLLGDSEEDLSISQRITAITDEQLQLREQRDQLTKRLNEVEAARNSASATGSETGMTHLIENLQREKENLEIEKQRLQQNLDEIRAQDKSVVPADLQRLINRMMEEKDVLQQERDQLNDKLSNIQSELQALNIEDDITGLSEWISRLTDERDTYKKEADKLQTQRDTLLHEREQLADNLDNEKERDQHIEALQNKIETLAADRETALRQNNKLRSEYRAAVTNLNNVKEHRARLLAESSGYEIELTEARDEQAKLRAQIQELATLRSQLLDERDKLAAENTAITTELEQVLSQLDGDPSRMKAVNEEGVGALKAMIEDISAQRDALEQQLQETRIQLADAETQLQVQQAAASMNGVDDLTYEPREPELLVGLVQELRTPMTSITGYIDLLLSESAGILGEMQRKFLQRVSVNISRLESMIDSLVHVTQLDTDNYELSPQPIDLLHLVEEAITNASLQFREKGLAVTLEIDEDIPPMPADEDAMKQVIAQLLSNAYLISPPDTEIQVTVVRQGVQIDPDHDLRNCVYVAIQDSGGGIPLEDVPRVFARKYKADNPLIDGLGDTGVGMSIAKALIEAHDGKLWVETKEGIGSIFAFAIPLDLEPMKKRD